MLPATPNFVVEARIRFTGGAAKAVGKEIVMWCTRAVSCCKFHPLQHLPYHVPVTWVIEWLWGPLF